MGSLKSARVSVRLATVTRHTRELPSLLAPGRSDISKMSSLTAVSDGSERSEGAQDGPTRTLAGVAIARSYPRALTIGPPGVLTRDPAGLFLSEERGRQIPPARSASCGPRDRRLRRSLHRCAGYSQSQKPKKCEAAKGVRTSRVCSAGVAGGPKRSDVETSGSGRRSREKRRRCARSGVCGASANTRRSGARVFALPHHAALQLNRGHAPHPDRAPAGSAGAGASCGAATYAPLDQHPDRGPCCSDCRPLAPRRL